MRSKIVVMKSNTSGVGLIGLGSLLDVYDNTKAGDMVTVYPGTYDIGDNTIILKDGVRWMFIGKPTITSNSPNGTFTDNGLVINVEAEGDAEVINTSGQIFKIEGKSLVMPNIMYPPRNTAKNSLKFFPFTPETLAPSERKVLTVNMGSELKHKDNIVFQVLGLDRLASDYPNDALEEWVTLSDTYPHVSPGAWGKATFACTRFPQINRSEREPALMATYDYTKAMRRHLRHRAGDRYETDKNGQDMPTGYTYEDIGIGLLVGAYWNSGFGGVYNVPSAQMCESVWLTKSGDDIILNIAVYNSLTEDKEFNSKGIIVHD